MTSVRFDPDVVAGAIRVVARPHKAPATPFIFIKQVHVCWSENWIRVMGWCVLARNTSQAPAQKDGGGCDGEKRQIQLNGEIVEAHGSLQKKTCVWTFGEVRAALAAVWGVRCQKNNRFCPYLDPNVTAEARAVNFTYLAGEHR